MKTSAMDEEFSEVLRAAKMSICMMAAAFFTLLAKDTNNEVFQVMLRDIDKAWGCG